MSLPVIAVTVGDPSGIGPEIAVKAIRDPRVVAACRPRLYGPHTVADLNAFPAGRISAESAKAAYDAIVAAVADAREGRVAAIATAPVNKEAFAAAGLSWRGHTDLLAHLCGVDDVAMLFWSDRLRVVLATVHIPLAEVPRTLTADRLLAVIRLTARSLPRFGLPAPRLAVAGLNPHAGENGVLGLEDRDVLAPAVALARIDGIDVSGPLPADTLFVRAARGEFDVVIAAYHDQGLVPVKLLAFGRAVNVTLGLPIIRTSVDHGTAFDIARQGVADEGSLIEAILLAARLTETSAR
ncbi:MAG TPA: 4-hydroxythreonine-4-phosphate dehydrogenase PdxA [Vicinamibacterales bacterium]|nr:4-hydroxythreonine-4-phosphate dehydrogenase PdxA [Vicinamibacterales bacterium]